MQRSIHKGIDWRGNLHGMPRLCAEHWFFHIPSNYVVERVRRSAKASRREDLQVEHPIWCGDSSTFHFHATLASMLSPTLIGDQVVEVREPGEKRLLTAAWMVKRFHHEQLPLDGVVGLV